MFAWSVIRVFGTRGVQWELTAWRMKVEIHSSLENVGVERWDQLMLACGAPVFYYSSFLTAFERLPLHAVRESYYVVGVGDGGELQFGFPAFLLSDTDPMRVLATHFTDLL